MHPDSDAIAALVFSIYTQCPKRSKPARRSNGVAEWTNLAAVVVTSRDGEYVCASIATGVKASPDSAVVTACGGVLHDCHAEILAIRGFNRYLIDECTRLIHHPNYISPCVNRPNLDDPTRFDIDEHCKIVLLATEIPCGDASMEQLGAGAKENWSFTPAVDTMPLRGRSYFSELGAVRTKPGRFDSLPTLSKSCSDKILARQYTSLLLTPTSLLISPRHAYISTLLLPSPKLATNRVALERAFGKTGRSRAVVLGNPGGEYGHHSFDIAGFTAQFPDSRDVLADEADPKPSTISLLYVHNLNPPAEALAKGIKLGIKRKKPDAAASTVSRRRLLHDVMRVIDTIAGSKKMDIKSNYLQIKVHDPARVEMKHVVRAALGNWVPTGPDDFCM
ncbi:adenosine deaminase/editase [Limtongia smithiae]|uniref:adenosine deaminase/editase n=1 Tax=Limtongia smithiae TaxID=1125753 RepID=UPI0034CD2B5A